MFFVVVIAAKSVPVVIPIAAIVGIGEHDVLIGIVTDPLVAAFRFGQIDCFPAQPTARDADSGHLSR
jgi:hypothetical protein